MTYIEEIFGGIRECLSFVNDDAPVVFTASEYATIHFKLTHFLEEAGELLEQVRIPATRIGALIVFEAEGHGTGFWDEFDSSTDIGERLSEIARKHFAWESYVYKSESNGQEVVEIIFDTRVMGGA